MRSYKTWAQWSEVDLRAGARAVADRLPLLPGRWSAYVGVEYERRGGAWDADANAWALKVTEEAPGRVPLSASDEDLRAAAQRAAGDCKSVEEFAAVRGQAVAREMMARQCGIWGIDAPKAMDDMPAVRRMACPRWWLRRLRRAHGRRCDGSAIRAGVVRRGLWPYASQDAVERRGEQRRRNERAIAAAVIECEGSGQSLPLADVVKGSIANPEVKRSELMVRIKGCDAIASGDALACEFWTLTAPSRFHAQRLITSNRKTENFAVSSVPRSEKSGKKKSRLHAIKRGDGGVEPNPNYCGATPKEAQAYLSKVWARARAAWKRRGLAVFGLRTAEPHHDGCPHWHLIAYGTARDVRFARRLLRVYALRESPDEAGARKHRFVTKKAKRGKYGAAYAAKYISKNINGEGMGKARDGEAGREVSDSVRRVDAWAATWGIRQFQFFGCPSISIWRALRKLRGPVAVAGAMLERARSAADDSDFAEFWRCAVRGGLQLIYRAADCLTAYGDAAAARIAGVSEGARRALLPVKDWVIRWKGGKKRDGLAVAFDLPWSCANNCTRGGVERFEDAAAAVFAVG